MHEGLGELDALLHARRVGLDGPVARLAEADVVEHLVGAADRLVARQAGELARERHERRGGHARHVAVLLRHVAEAAAHLERLLRRVEAEGRHLPAVGRQEAEERLEEGRLAGPVRAEKAGRSRPEDARDARKGLDEAVGDRQVLELDERRPVVTHCLDSTSRRPVLVPFPSFRPTGGALRRRRDRPLAQPQDGLALDGQHRAAERHPSTVPTAHLMVRGRAADRRAPRSGAGRAAARPAARRTLPWPPTVDPQARAPVTRRARGASTVPGPRIASSSRTLAAPLHEQHGRGARCRGRRVAQPRWANAIARGNAGPVRFPGHRSRKRPSARTSAGHGGERVERRRADRSPPRRAEAATRRSHQAIAPRPPSQTSDAGPEPRRAVRPVADEEARDVLVPVGVRALRQQQTPSRSPRAGPARARPRRAPSRPRASARGRGRRACHPEGLPSARSRGIRRRRHRRSRIPRRPSGLERVGMTGSTS